MDYLPNAGIIIETPGFIPYYSGLQNLRLLAGIRRKVTDDQIRKALKITGLDPDSRLPVRKYSLGMRQRLGIAQAIMEQPDILILDEPMNGLDKHGVADIRELLMALKSRESSYFWQATIQQISSCFVMKYMKWSWET